MILLLDVWAIHISKTSDDDFLPWLERTYKFIHPVFIPGGCAYHIYIVVRSNSLSGTGVFQPADVGLQRIVKHIIKAAATDWLTATIMRQLKDGIDPTDVVIPNELGLLRDESVGWIVAAWRHLEAQPELVRKAWSGSAVGELNLSWESLTGAAGMANYQKHMKNLRFAQELLDDTVIPIPKGVTTLPEDDTGVVVYDDDLALDADTLAACLLEKSLPDGCVRDEDGNIEPFTIDDTDIIIQDEVQGDDSPDGNASDDAGGSDVDEWDPVSDAERQGSTVHLDDSDEEHVGAHSSTQQR